MHAERYRPCGIKLSTRACIQARRLHDLSDHEPTGGLRALLWRGTLARIASLSFLLFFPKQNRSGEQRHLAIMRGFVETALFIQLCDIAQ